MATLHHRVAALIEHAGCPVLVGLQHRGTPPIYLTHGSTAAAGPLNPSALAYAASLAKQITAACAALLVRHGRLDMETTLAEWVPELPDWTHAVRLRHLVHHTAGMPPDEQIDAMIPADGDRTTTAVLQALNRLPAPTARPGGQYVYSNAGYVCLAVAVERAAGRRLPAFAQTHMFEPAGMSSSRYWPGPASQPPGARPLPNPHPAPLSLGDGGIWTTATDLMSWNQALDADELGISDLLHTASTLDDGTTLDYAWGLGIRTYARHRIYRHGGGWPGLRAQLIRIPDQRSGLTVIALTNDTDRTASLANALLDMLVQPGTTS
ncbi:serine hydrolase domain-containing protein [Paractinoplanes toevensis]|uniref:Lipoprotein n=1 Tax=Paractinoplanes toevensis TaxID=571911 RepID=A0A920BPR8_9ACTN|nr:serine hydrolase domain-containing protein [Actinoplanes toevensis]GIM96659.1 lipoprotein [Actinoplanes toevensis]